ncbi:MAG: DNA polymerase III subunit delta [Lachnospiraceae bacterium]|nr:DNA polymerase III subunit delta [Lachnospiraceae bacterium]
MKQLEADIKNKIYKKLYVLFGPQSYNRKRYVKALTDLFLPQNDEINLTSFYGKKVDLKEVYELAQTMPFLAERRVIVLENTELFTKTSEELAELLESIPDSCCIIFSEEKIDARLKQTKTAKSVGCVAEFGDLSEADMRNWILNRLSKEHRQITQNALELFLTRCGDDMWQVSNELEKVISYTFNKDGIRPEDIEAVIPPLPEDKIFKMIDAMIAGNTKEMFRYYSDLLLLRSNLRGILALITEQFRLMLHVKEMSEDNVSIKDMATALKMRDTRVKMALPVARKSSKINLVRAIDMCAQTDERIKNGQTNEQIGLETLLNELCHIDL